MDWEDHLKSDMKFATDTLLNKGSLTPMFILHPRDGKTLPILTPFFSDEDKTAVLEYLRLMCIADDVVGVSSICEAWMVTALPDTKLDTVRPSESPGRIEIITVTMTYRDEQHKRRKTLSMMAEIIRNGEGKAIDTEPFDRVDHVSEGRFVNILPIDRPSLGQQERARRQIARDGHEPWT